MNSAARPKAAATAWITEAVARPNTETTAARRPWPSARDRTNRIAGPGIRFSARAEIMNKAVVCGAGIVLPFKPARCSGFAFVIAGGQCAD
jgi:hypothetical protein